MIFDNHDDNDIEHNNIETFKENVEMVDNITYILKYFVAVEDIEAFINLVRLYRMKDSNVFIDEVLITLKRSHPREFNKLCFFC
jgi:tetrahydromethanopterin S-methyltransferase subunit A